MIVLTARSAAEDRIRGLGSGADDYVTKPFSPTEVVLRGRAVLNPRHRHPGGREPRRAAVAGRGTA